MGLFEGKTTTERNKIIAAGVLGLVALIALYMAFGSSLFGSKPTTVTTKSSPTPRPNAPSSTTGDRALPTVDEQRFMYETTPVDYRPGSAGAPDPGRNIFAFYEPPPPCNPNKPGDCPPPPPPKPMTPPPTPSPTPTPPYLLRAPIPMTVYAGAGAFKLQVDGEFFTPESRIFFNQTEMPTAFVSSKRLAADIPANLTAQEGSRQISVRTSDGILYSNPVSLMVIAPPKPNVQFIGGFLRKMRNNDVAVLMSSGSTTPFSARLNDVVAGQFRLIDITAEEVVFEDVNLGFKHRVAITKAPTGTTGPGGRDGFPFGPGAIPPGSIPGIPANVQRYVPPPTTNRPAPSKKEDVDDNDKPR